MKTHVDPNSLAIDSTALNGLKRAAQQESPEAIRAAAKQFESVLMNMMLKSMRDTVPQEGMFDNEQSRMFMGMLDQQLSSNLSQKGLGLAEVLVKQLTKQAAPTADATTSDAAHSGAANRNGLSVTFESIPAVKATTSAIEQTAQMVRAAYQQWDSATKDASTTSEDNNDDSAAPDTDTHLSDEEAWQRSVASLPPLLEQSQAWLQKATHASTQLAKSAATQVVSEVAQKTKHFVETLLPHAETASARSGIPAKFMLGQAALESGWGKHEIKMSDGRSSHNLFGIKADASWKGKVVNSITTEYVHGVKHLRVEKFRAYDSYSEAFQDYAKLISQNPRYQHAMQNTHSATAYAQALQQAGYATDPQYSKKLSQVIHRIIG